AIHDVLELDPLLERTEVVPQVSLARGLHAAENALGAIDTNPYFLWGFALSFLEATMSPGRGATGNGTAGRCRGRGGRVETGMEGTSGVRARLHRDVRSRHAAGNGYT